MAVFRSKAKYTLEVTPIFDIFTLLMAFCFMYSFTLEKQAEEFYGAVEIFRWLFVIGLLLLARGVVIKDDYEVTMKEALNILFYTMIGIMALGIVNITVSALARATGMMSVADTTFGVVLNYGVVDNLFIAFLAGYNEEIAFAAIYFLIYRLAPDRPVGIGRFQVNFAHLVTMWAVAVLFPIYHSIAYNIWGPVFIVLYIGRIVLTEIMVRSRRIEPSILAHATWDLITVLPLLFIFG